MFLWKDVDSPKFVWGVLLISVTSSWVSLWFSKESMCNAGDLASISGSGRSSGERNGSPLQYSCLGNPMDRRVWWATVHGVTRVRHNLLTKQQPPPDQVG